MKEIGSEFWCENNFNNSNNLSYFELGADTKYLMSGRTALDYILENLDDQKKIVYMPDYCCESMVTPFINHGYKIKYYETDIINNNYKINYDEDCSIFYAMSYFGYSNSNMDSHIKHLKRHAIIIEDITHRLLQSTNHCSDSDFLIASLRKWFPIYTGAIAVNMNSKFKLSIDDYDIDESLLLTKKQAMTLKYQYISDKLNDKTEYLELYRKSNALFNNYQHKKMDDESLQILRTIDINKIIAIRRNNALIIEKKLEKNSKIKLLYRLKPEDCPLFVPITIDNRDYIRQELIQENIYCPIHWPNFNNFKNHIYKIELSLICDHRYQKEDIIKYLETLQRIVGE